MSNHVNGEAPAIDPVAWMRGQMVMAAREIEKRFPGCNVTLLISEPGAALLSHPLKPSYNYASTASLEDMVAVVKALVVEVGEAK